MKRMLCILLTALTVLPFLAACGGGAAAPVDMVTAVDDVPTETEKCAPGRSFRTISRR